MVEAEVGRVMMLEQTAIHCDVIQRRLSNWAFQGLIRRVMLKMMRRESLLLLHFERIDLLKRGLLHMLRHMCLEVLEGSGLMASMQGTL